MTASDNSFRERLRNGELLVGTWIKTPNSIVVEVLASTALDFLCLDAEHAPFDRLAIDSCVLASRAHGKPVLVRVPSTNAVEILNALDIGATGVVVPHVIDGLSARAVAKASRYAPGGRGYAGSPRAAAYGRTSMLEHIEKSSIDTTVVVQIEDAEGVAAIETIASVHGIDCLFIGRADLAVSYSRASVDAPEVTAAVEQICAVGCAAGKRLGIHLADPAEVPFWRDRGITLFLIASDQAFLINGARNVCATSQTA